MNLDLFNPVKFLVTVERDYRERLFPTNKK